MADTTATRPAAYKTGAETPTFFPEPSPSTLITTTTLKPSQPSSDAQPQQPTAAAQTLTSPSNTIHIELTYSDLSIPFATTFTRSPTAGATVLFLGTTRSYFRDPTRPVSRLSYSAYTPLALRTLLSLATATQEAHGLERVCVMHRLGEVAVGEESIVVAVSSPHRGAAWAGAEDLLEQVKDRAEIWKREWFVDGGEEVGRDGQTGHEVGVWRDNRESDRMGRRKVDGDDNDTVVGKGVGD